MRKLLILPLLFICCICDAQDLETYLNNLESDYKKADTIFALARKSFRSALFNKAEYWLDKGQEFADKSGSAEMIARYHVERGNLKYMQGKMQEGIASIHASSPYLAKTDSYDLHNSSLLIIGNCFNALEQNDSAFIYYKRCEKYNNEKNPYRNWLVYSQIGELFSHTDDFKQAEKYYLKAYDLTANKEGKPNHGFVLTQFANFYLQWNKPNEFGKLLEEYNKLIEANNRSKNSVAKHNLMFLDWSKNKKDDKIDFLKKVKDSNFINGNILMVILANNYIISHYELNKNNEEALKYVLENEQMASRAGFLNVEYHTLITKYSLLKKLNRPLEANTVADKIFIIKDSLLEVQKREILYQLNTKYETEQKEKEITLLTTKHELARLQLKSETERREALQRESQLRGEKLAKELLLRQALERENILNDSALVQQQRLNLLLESDGKLRENELSNEKNLNASLFRENQLKQESIDKDKKNKRTLWTGIFLLALAGGIILFQFSRQVNKNRIIRKQSEEMEVLNREIHHRVKNNLQVISSLLDIQSQTLKDEDAAEVIKESRQRVQSMAFIHQNLYQSSSVQEIELNSYINTLAEHLFQSYNIQKDRIRFHADIDKINLHTDTVIPLGMILNELISNSLKYAFKDIEAGEIKVAMKQKENQLLLQVKDNGCGLPAGFDIGKLESFGFKVIRAFAQKLKAKLIIDGSHGTNVELLISKFKTI